MRFTKSQIERVAREFWSTTDQLHRDSFDIVGAVDASLTIDLVPLNNSG